jgi:hypothetical protein
MTFEIYRGMSKGIIAMFVVEELLLSRKLTLKVV